MTAHKHAVQMNLYADDALETEEPWLRWEMSNDGAYWVSCPEHPRWEVRMQYRHKPKVIAINGFAVPEPLRVGPPEGTRVYLVDPANGTLLDYTWANNEAYLNKSRLELGMLHSTRLAAETHLMALLSFTQEPTK